MNCEYCPSFNCKLATDYKRHIKTQTHLLNKELFDKLENAKNKEINELKDYHIHYIIWEKKMRYILVDLRDIKGLGYKSIKEKNNY